MKKINFFAGIIIGFAAMFSDTIATFINDIGALLFSARFMNGLNIFFILPIILLVLLPILALITILTFILTKRTFTPKSFLIDFGFNVLGFLAAYLIFLLVALIASSQFSINF